MQPCWLPQSRTYLLLILWAVRAGNVADGLQRRALEASTTTASTSAAIGWMRVDDRRTVVSSEVLNTTVFMNSRNWVARTMEYGVRP